jgi:hypothetical protein
MLRTVIIAAAATVAIAAPTYAGSVLDGSGVSEEAAQNPTSVTGFNLAGLWQNALTGNGIAWNGLAKNGLAWNALTLNGLAWNGLSVNGFGLNGLNINGQSGNGQTRTGQSANGGAINGRVIAIKFRSE